MQTKNNPSMYNHIGLLAIAVLVILVGVLFSRRVDSQQVRVEFVGSSPSSDTSPNVTVNVFLKKGDKEEITAYDFQFEYDTTEVRLISADDGGYFTDAMEVKWDLENAWFSAAANPSGYKDNAVRVHPDKPVLSLTFQTLDTATPATLRLKDMSQIYVSQKGGFQPAKVHYIFATR